MSASTLTSTIAPSALASHGKLSSPLSLEAMDVDRDGQHPPSGDRPQPNDTMDTSLDPTRKATGEVRIPGLLPGNDIATTQQHPQPAVLERPREENYGGNAQNAQGQLAPLPQTITTSSTTSMPQTTAVPQDTPLQQNILLTSNLISLYGLDSLAATVARTDPQTGIKINKMRKSYEGQLKTFALSGRNKSVKHDPSKGMGLSEMAAWPEEEWQKQKVDGKDVKNGMPEALKAKLDQAMQMQPGPVPDNDKWEDLLGIEKVKPVDSNKDKGLKNALANKPNGQQVNGIRPPNHASTHHSQVTESIRARRTTKKRRYDEGSFEGYGEGYVDDEMEIGYTSGESRSTRNSAGNRKRRKTKDYTNSPAEYGGSRNNSFTAGPMGISASYGR